MKTYVRTAALGTVILALVVAFGSATASAQVTINKCQASKKKCVSKRVKAVLGCHGKAENKGISVDSTCLTKAATGFSNPGKGCMDKLEAKGGCLTTGDAAALAATIDAFALDAVTQLDPGFPVPVLNKCAAGKKKCVSKMTAGLLGCHAKAELKGVLDPACLAKYTSAFPGCFSKLEASPPCLTTADAAALETTIDAFVDDVVCALDPSEGTCPPPPGTPTALEFTPDASDPQSELDSGWLGFTHDLPFISDATLTVAVTGCANPSPPWGVCTFSGPIPNANAGDGTIDNRRCSNDTSIACTTDGVCAPSHCIGGPGVGAVCTMHSQCPQSSCSGSGTCEYFWGSHLPVVGGGTGLCLRQEIQGQVSGTADIEGGAIVRDMYVREHVFWGGGLAAAPCPVCSGDGTPNDGVRSGSCSGGDRDGLACDANGVSPLFGTTSLDCPPLAQQYDFATSRAPLHIVSSTGSQSLTLSAASPACTTAGFGALRCACNTCNSGTPQLPCATDADCPDPAGPIGAICGGKRCLGGINGGAACTAHSECPGGGLCGVPGEPTRPNACLDGTCTSLGGDEGYCAAGPMSSLCAAPEQYRGCFPETQTTDCPITQTCTLQNRLCFLDNGQIGGSIVVTGAADAPIDALSEPTLGAVYCVAPTSASSADVILGGLPGPTRLRLREQVKATFQ